MAKATINFLLLTISDLVPVKPVQRTMQLPRKRWNSETNLNNLIELKSILKKRNHHQIKRGSIAGGEAASVFNASMDSPPTEFSPLPSSSPFQKISAELGAIRSTVWKKPRHMIGFVTLWVILSSSVILYLTLIVHRKFEVEKEHVRELLVDMV